MRRDQHHVDAAAVVGLAKREKMRRGGREGGRRRE
jgi:hypothetical protein